MTRNRKAMHALHPFRISSWSCWLKFWGMRYCLALTDDFSGAVHICLFSEEQEWYVAATEKFLADFLVVRSNVSDQTMTVTYFLRRNCIWHDTCALCSPQQHCTLEWNWSETLFEMGRCLFIPAKEFWPNAVMVAVYMRNRCYNNPLKQTPYLLRSPA